MDLISSRHKKSDDHFVMKNKSLAAFSAGYNTFELGPVSQGICVFWSILYNHKSALLRLAVGVAEAFRLT